MSARSPEPAEPEHAAPRHSAPHAAAPASDGPPAGGGPLPPVASSAPATPPLPRSGGSVAHGPTPALPPPGSPQPLPPGGGPGAPGEGRAIGEPSWAAWQGLLGFAAALIGTLLLGAVVVGVLAIVLQTPLSQDSPTLNIAGVIVQDLVFVGAAVGFAAITARPRAWHFGLRRTRLWSTLGWAVLGLFLYFVFNISYDAIVNPEAEQSVAEALGVNESASLLIIGALVIIVMAPIAEEFFFRAFLYRTLRNSLGRKLGIPVGAVIGGLLTGLLFGVIHVEPDNVAKTVPIIPLLAVLGTVFCLIYERTGSLFTVIGMHAAVNALAYGAVAKNGALVALIFGAAMIVACVVLPRFLSRGPATAAA